MEKQFTNIYNKNIWGNGSGKGSSPDYNKKYIEFLESFIKEKNIQSIYDLGCGDWQFSQFVDWNGATYIGADCVKSVIQKNQNDYSDLDGRINFIHMDILVNQGHKYILLINGYKEAKGSDRTIENRYRYAKIDCRLEPLCKYKPEILFTYRFKQVALIS